MDLHNSGFSVVSQDTEYFDLQLASEPNSEDIIPSTEGESILRISELSRHGIDGVYSWLEQSPRGDCFARCKLCQKCINIEVMGQAALRTHHFSRRHQQHVIATMQRRIPSHQF